jgi:RNA polymerase sigma-70 factor (ECF subfamily)
MFFKDKKQRNNQTDLDILKEYQLSGDRSLAGKLFVRYSHLVFGICMKYLKNEDESRDAVMNIFEKLLEDLKKHQIDNFKGWLHTVARNHCLMYLRSGKKMIKVPEENLTDVMELNYSLHPVIEDEKEVNLNKMDECLKKLAEQQKICVELFYLEEKCYKEIADLTRFSMNEVKSYIQNGKRNLKNCMEKNND